MSEKPLNYVLMNLLRESTSLLTCLLSNKVSLSFSNYFKFFFENSTTYFFQTSFSNSYFSIGILTPTFKLKRPQAQAMFQTQIDAMYKEIEAEEAAATGIFPSFLVFFNLS